MNNYSNTTYSLPNELVFFKNKVLSRKDPIRRYTFDLKEISYILKRISKFSVPSKDLFRKYQLQDKGEFIKLLCKHYLKSNTVELKDYDFIKKFICIFFDVNNPIYDESNDFIWIYPRISLKNYIKKSIFEDNTESFYFDNLTLNKLLTIFTSFTKYEYNNCDENISLLFEGLNYPSLILANIDLYEKGYIEVIEESNQTKLFLNKKNKENQKTIFSENREFLKTSILDFLKINENIEYSLSDFL